MAGVEDEVVPVDAVAFVITHAGEEHSPSLSLLDDVLDYFRTPIVVLSIVQWISSDGQSIGGTKDHTAVAAGTIFFTTSHFVIRSIVGMYIEGALVDTHLASNTAIVVSIDNEF